MDLKLEWTLVAAVKSSNSKVEFYLSIISYEPPPQKKVERAICSVPTFSCETTALSALQCSAKWMGWLAARLVQIL